MDSGLCVVILALLFSGFLVSVIWLFMSDESTLLPKWLHLMAIFQWIFQLWKYICFESCCYCCAVPYWFNIAWLFISYIFQSFGLSSCVKSKTFMSVTNLNRVFRGDEVIALYMLFRKHFRVISIGKCNVFRFSEFFMKSDVVSLAKYSLSLKVNLDRVLHNTIKVLCRNTIKVLFFYLWPWKIISFLYVVCILLGFLKFFSNIKRWRIHVTVFSCYNVFLWWHLLSSYLVFQEQFGFLFPWLHNHVNFTSLCYQENQSLCDEISAYKMQLSFFDIC